MRAYDRSISWPITKTKIGKTEQTILARMFLDFWTGIHYPQLQNASRSKLAFNTVEFINPVKQSQGFMTPEGVFIKSGSWALIPIPNSLIHDPWDLTAMEQIYLQNPDWEKLILPIVSPIGRLPGWGRNSIWAAQEDPEVKKESRGILARHTFETKRLKYSMKRTNYQRNVPVCQRPFTCVERNGKKTGSSKIIAFQTLQWPMREKLKTYPDRPWIYQR